MDAIWDTTGVARLPEQRFSWVEEARLHYGPATLQQTDATLGRLERVESGWNLLSPGRQGRMFPYVPAETSFMNSGRSALTEP